MRVSDAEAKVWPWFFSRKLNVCARKLCLRSCVSKTGLQSRGARVYTTTQMESSMKEEEWKNYVDAAKEFATAAKANTDKMLEQLQGELLVLKESVKDSHLLPPKVRSMYAGKAVHINELRSTHVPPMLWKTRCGWLFGGKSFAFGGDEWEVTCLKCIRAEQGGQ